MINQLYEPLTDSVSLLDQSLLPIANALRWGAVACGAFMVALLGVALLQVFGLSLEWVVTAFLFRFGGGHSVSLMLVMVGLGFNVVVLLVSMLGVLAREWWAWGGILAIVVCNAVAVVGLGFSVGIVLVLLGGLCLFRLGQAWRVFRVNPIMLKEGRGRMRGLRSFVVLTVYLLMMSLFLLLTYLPYVLTTQNLDQQISSATGLIGRYLFAAVVGIQMLLIVFIAPALTSGAITHERERRTFDLLWTTLLGKPTYLMGKLEGSLGFILLLLLAAIPLQSIAFLFGGVSQTEIVIAFVLMSVTAFMLGTLGLYFSATQTRSLGANVRTYMVVFVGAVGVPAGVSLVLTILGNLVGDRYLLVQVLVTYGQHISTSLNPLVAGIATQEILRTEQSIWYYEVSRVVNGQVLNLPLLSPWLLFCLIYLMGATICLIATLRAMRRVQEG